MSETVPLPTQLLPLALGARALVASAHPQASRIGLETLRRGGSAADAAVSMAVAEWVLLPGMCGPGGDAFALVRDGPSGQTRALVGAGAAPRAFTPEYLAEQGLTELPTEGVLAASIPGAVAACGDLHAEYGRLPWADLLQPAIGLAREGFPLTERVAWNIDNGAAVLQRFGAGEPFLHNGAALRAGDRLLQPDLADTLEALASEGAEVFYRGQLAEQMVAYCRAQGSPVTLDDYAAHASEWAEPLRASYRGWEVVETPLPSPGIVVLQSLKLLEGWECWPWQRGSAATIHLQAEIQKLAFADRRAWCGDPRFVESPVAQLLAEEHLAAQRQRVDPERAAPSVPGHDGGTSYLAVADGDGNAVSFIHSLSRPTFGCGVIVPGTGVVLNNRTGRGFLLDEGHPNRLAGGKRTMSTLNAFLVERDGRLHLVGGTPGGDQQVQWNFQALTAWADFGLNPQQTVEFPRWQVTPGTDPETLGEPTALWVEERIPEIVLADLRRRGHRLRSLGTWARQGAMQLLELDHARGTLRGGTDPRAGGLALGW